MPYVIVQPEGDFEPLVEPWWIDGPPEAQQAGWEKLCLKLVEEARQLGQDKATTLFNVFLLFNEEEFPDRLQRSALEHLLDQRARRSGEPGCFS